MRAARVLLVGTLGLLLAACTGAKDKGKDNVRADLGKPKDLIVGKWKAADPAQLVQVCEFADDGTLKVTLKDVREAAAGKYRFTDDSTMEVEFQAPAEVKKAYRESVKAAKKAAAEAAGAGAVGKDLGIIGAASAAVNRMPDEFPEKDTAKVSVAPAASALAPGHFPAASRAPSAARADLELTLTCEKLGTMKFKKVK